MLEHSQDAGSSSTEHEEAVPAMLYQAWTNRRTSLEKGQLIRRWRASWAWLHRGQEGQCCIPLVSRLSAVRIFWCIAVQLKTLTFGLIFAFHKFPILKGGVDPWNWILYAEADEYVSSACHFQTTESLIVLFRFTFERSPHNLM
jgi:hypothetical protein